MTAKIPERREDMPGGPGSDQPPITPPKKKPATDPPEARDEAAVEKPKTSE